LLERLRSVGATIAVVVVFKAIAVCSLHPNWPELGGDVEFPVSDWAEKCLERAAGAQCEVMKEDEAARQENSGLYGRLKDAKFALSAYEKMQRHDKSKADLDVIVLPPPPQEVERAPLQLPRVESNFVIKLIL
jgi:hypothetical protein